ncbi:hypothetical protein GGR26_002302 [Lewinella marina]|uniref:Secretion system C-terminal sorting domain-containing protein n=1 Tax=Neolewinella marina TaxID=438751 RepID=A0A2G0CGB1_9BACT|nr:T9SS type A sorting domain-containing protein [Neolewinella marina]NJB86534.1 hypothetical protein [Neolewinella marina]PHK99012.1 hypothetical protein CGL56_06000 [Neolewinella marina]
MKHIFSLFLVGLVAVMNGQALCTINSTNLNQSFRTICSQGSNPALVNGIFTGTLVVDNVSYTIAAADLSAVTFSVDVIIRTEFKSHLTFAQPPTVARGTTVTAEFGKHVHSSISAYGVLYQPNQTGRNYSDFANRMSGSATVAPPAGGGEAILPITLVDWKARSARNSVELEWTTEREVNNHSFLVEHSTDGRNFIPITQISGFAQSTATLTYRYRHASPSPGTNYYRLTQYDLDGTAAVYAVITSEYPDDQAAPTAGGVYPNPALAGQALRFAAPSAPTTANLYHLDGRLIASAPVAATGFDGQFYLPSGLQAGVYVLRIGNRSQRLLVR